MKEKLNILVIHERDDCDGEDCVIGLVDHPDKARGFIKEYYGEYKEISFRDIRDSRLEWSMTIEVAGSITNDKYTITLEWLKLNEI